MEFYILEGFFFLSAVSKIIGFKKIFHVNGPRMLYPKVWFENAPLPTLGLLKVLFYSILNDGQNANF